MHPLGQGDVALYLLGISPTHFASFPHPFASFPHQICFVSPKKCFISPTVCCISPTKCFISPTVCCISLCNVVSRCQKIFYQIFSVFLIFGAKFYFKCVKWAPNITRPPTTTILRKTACTIYDNRNQPFKLFTVLSSRSQGLLCGPNLSCYPRTQGLYQQTRNFPLKTGFAPLWQNLCIFRPVV